jgi:hypothetical protein
MRILFTFCFLLTYSLVFAQLPEVEVADLTVKIASRSTQEYHYGFEAGDELTFNFSETSKKSLKQIEIIEYPGAIKYSGNRVSMVNKRIKINKKGVYIFRLTNGALVKHLCKVKIGRVPVDAKTIGFNTNVAWKELPDTTYTMLTKAELIRYDTVYSYNTKKELVKTETSAIEIFDKTEQVAAFATLGKPCESIIKVDLPVNKYLPFESSEIISWSYWIGVGQEGHKNFEANRQAYLKAAGHLISATGNPLVGLALNQFAFLPSGNAGSNVRYFFLPDNINAQRFMEAYYKKDFQTFERGDGVSASGRKEAPLQGTFYIGLYNDNWYNDINVNVKVMAVVVRKLYVEKRYRQASSITPIYENKLIKDPIVTLKKVLVNMD